MRQPGGAPYIALRVGDHCGDELFNSLSNHAVGRLEVILVGIK